MDIQITVKEILATGVTQNELAVKLKCSQALVSAFVTGKRGASVRYDIGKRLEAIHKEVLRKRRPTPP